MSENNKNNFFKKIQNFIFSNYIKIIILLLILLILFIGFQLYNYFKIQNIKNSSVSFFEIIQENQNDLSNLESLIDDDNIFSILSKLKLIQQNNENKNFNYSNELYKDLLFTSDLDNLYKSSIASNASYTMINASYEENEEEVVVIPSQGENNEISSESKEKSVLTVVVEGGNGTDSVSEQLYAGG